MIHRFNSFTKKYFIVKLRCRSGPWSGPEGPRIKEQRPGPGDIDIQDDFQEDIQDDIEDDTLDDTQDDIQDDTRGLTLSVANF